MLEESMSTVHSSSLWASIFSWFTPTVFFVFLNLTIGTIYFTSSLASSKPGGDGEGQKHEGEETPKLVRSPSVLQRLKSINLSGYSYRSQVPVSSSAGFEKMADADDVHQGFKFSFQQQLQQHTPEQQQLCRSPSVLQRIKSFNLYSYFSPEPNSVQKTQEIYPHFSPEKAPEKEEEQVPEHEEENRRGGLEGEKEEENEGIFQIKGRSLDEMFSQVSDVDVDVTRTKSDTIPASGELQPKLPKKMKKSASVKSPFSHLEEEDIVETRRPATVREGKAKATEEDDEVDAKADDFINKFKQQLKLQRIDSILTYKDMVNKGSGR